MKSPYIIFTKIYHENLKLLNPAATKSVNNISRFSAGKVERIVYVS